MLDTLHYFPKKKKNPKKKNLFHNCTWITCIQKQNVQQSRIQKIETDFFLENMSDIRKINDMHTKL